MKRNKIITKNIANALIRYKSIPYDAEAGFTISDNTDHSKTNRMKIIANIGTTS
jgi:hypothetical protein